MREGYLKPDQQEKYSADSNRTWFVRAWRIVNVDGHDIVQPWSHTKKEARETAKALGINLI